MVQALADTHIVRVQTNVAFLIRLMQDPAFAAADLDTGLIERQRATLLPQPPSADLVTLALASAAMLVKQGLSHSEPQDDAQGPLADRDPGSQQATHNERAGCNKAPDCNAP